MAEKQIQEEIRYIIRMASADLDGKKPVYLALRKLKGVSHRLALIIAKAFEKESGKPYNELLGKLSDEEIKIIESIIKEPEKHGIPNWVYNRNKGFYTGESGFAITNELDFAIREDIKRLNRVKSRRGLRHSWGLPLRGQRTKGRHRGKGSSIGVMKKESKTASKKKTGSKK